MISADQHLHSVLSPDAQSDLLAIGRAALAQELDAVTVTDHVDCGHPSPEFTTPPPPGALVASARALADAFPSLQVGLGVELGWTPANHADTAAWLAAFTALQAPDYVLLSLHVVDGWDTYNQEYYQGKSREKAYGDYIDTLLLLLEAGLPGQALAHLGYVCKFSPLPDPVWRYREFPDKFDRALREVVRRGLALEVNTATIARHGSPQPTGELLARFHGLGGIITFGSDAHAPDKIAQSFAQARILALAAGFREYAVFHKGSPVMRPL